MNIYKIENVKKIYANEKIKQLISTAMFNPTDGRVKSAAEGIYGKQQGHFYVAELDETVGIVGIVGVRRVDNEYVEIMHIAVDESYRQQGVATKMIKYVDEFERVDRIIAETDEDAMMFYKKFGFKTKRKEDIVTGRIRYACTFQCQ